MLVQRVLQESLVILQTSTISHFHAVEGTHGREDGANSLFFDGRLANGRHEAEQVLLVDPLEAALIQVNVGDHLRERLNLQVLALTFTFLIVVIELSAVHVVHETHDGAAARVHHLPYVEVDKLRSAVVGSHDKVRSSLSRRIDNFTQVCVTTIVSEDLVLQCQVPLLYRKAASIFGNLPQIVCFLNQSGLLVGDELGQETVAYNQQVNLELISQSFDVGHEGLLQANVKARGTFLQELPRLTVERRILRGHQPEQQGCVNAHSEASKALQRVLVVHLRMFHVPARRRLAGLLSCEFAQYLLNVTLKFEIHVLLRGLARAFKMLI